MKIYAIEGSTEFSEYDEAKLPPCDIFVYFYEYECYEGSGFSVWKNGDKFGYHYLGHCSCYGPLENIDSNAIYTLEEVEDIVKQNYDANKGPEVLAFLKEKIALADVKPVTPEKAWEEVGKNLPNEVVQAFNECLVESFDGKSSVVIQKDVVDRMISKGLSKEDIYNKGWLNVESLYRSAGWMVDYDRPGYNEAYPAKYIFRKNV